MPALVAALISLIVIILESAAGKQILQLIETGSVTEPLRMYCGKSGGVSCFSDRLLLAMNAMEHDTSGR